jgi:hypothetical protein
MQETSTGGDRRAFASTLWSVVLAASLDFAGAERDGGLAADAKPAAGAFKRERALRVLSQALRLLREDFDKAGRSDKSARGSPGMT